MTTTMRGRKAVFLNNETVEQALRGIQSGTFKSRYLTIKLVEMGFVEASVIKGQGRGRPRVVYSLSEKGQKQISGV